jgi:hypothetical protein
VAVLLLGAGCAAATAPAFPGRANGDTLLEAWLIPEDEETIDAPPGERRHHRAGRGRVGLGAEIAPSGGADFIVVEGIPDRPEPTAVTVRVSTVATRTVQGAHYAVVYVKDEPADQERVAGLFPLEPEPAASPVATTLGPAGLWLTGAPFFNWSDGRSYRGEGVWRRVAPGAVGDDGVSCAGPTADSETPHVYPECLALHLGDDSARHSPLYGFAADGYPVHGPWADLELPARSSWRLRDYDTPDSPTGCGESGRRTCLLTDPLDPAAGTVPAPAAGPDTAEIAPGAFFEDYWFDIGLDDGSPHGLDAFNGHVHDDDGGYHYHITRIQNGDGSFTDVFPYIVGPWFRGELRPGAVAVPGPSLSDPSGAGRATDASEQVEPSPSSGEPPLLCIRSANVCD